MTGTTRSSDGLDPRAKKALLRSWRRGIREMDLILGRFADAEIASLNEEEIEQYEKLLDVSDLELFSFMTGERTAPPAVDTPLFRRIVAFSRSQGLAFPS
jgi:antitoxin CptB